MLKHQARTGSETADVLLRQRAASKRAEFERSWLDAVRSDGRIHANYNAGTVKTGRLSSSDPNMQQVSKVLRPAFIPSPGHYMADFDYSQIELRVAAFVSGCVPMIEAFNRGDDLHSRLAATITGKPIEEVTKDDRQKGKSANFGLLYGMGAEGFQDYASDAYGVEMTYDEAVHVRNSFFELWEGMDDWHARTKRIAQRDGQIVSPLGRVRRLPNIWSSNPRLESEAQRQAINSPVQGMASDLLQLAGASMQGLVIGTTAIEGLRLVGTVHDSLVAELPTANWEQVAEQVVDRMEHLNELLARMGVEFTVPLVADYDVGTRWSLDDVSNPQAA